MRLLNTTELDSVSGGTTRNIGFIGFATPVVAIATTSPFGFFGTFAVASASPFGAVAIASANPFGFFGFGGFGGFGIKK